MRLKNMINLFLMLIFFVPVALYAEDDVRGENLPDENVGRQTTSPESLGAIESGLSGSLAKAIYKFLESNKNNDSDGATGHIFFYGRHIFCEQATTDYDDKRGRPAPGDAPERFSCSFAVTQDGNVFFLFPWTHEVQPAEISSSKGKQIAIRILGKDAKQVFDNLRGSSIQKIESSQSSIRKGIQLTCTDSKSTKGGKIQDQYSCEFKMDSSGTVNR